MEESKNTQGKWLKRLKQMGWAAFFFFLLKGLLWLAVFFGLGKYFFGGA
ncbi:MAG: hypothetical protein AAF798_06005 [Bacteroidota bacterium]